MELMMMAPDLPVLLPEGDERAGMAHTNPQEAGYVIHTSWIIFVFTSWIIFVFTSCLSWPRWPNISDQL